MKPTFGNRVRASSLSSGLIAMPMGAVEFQHQPVKHELLRRTPMAREVTMLEIADIVDFLLSDKAAFIIGVDLLVDGDLMLVMTV